MKSLLLSCLLFSLSLTVYAQSVMPIDSAKGLVSYTAIVSAPGATQAQLYGRALVWLASLPVSPNDPTVKDATSGIIVAHVGVPFVNGTGMARMPCTLWREVRIQVKDGRAKYDMTNFQCQLYAPTPGQPSQPTKAQMKLTPLEEYLITSDWRNYTKDGKPRMYTTGFLTATTEQAAADAKALTAALQTKSDW